MQRCPCGYDLIDGMQRCSECGRPRGPAQIDAVVPGWLMFALAANPLVAVWMVVLLWDRWEATMSDAQGAIVVGYVGLFILANIGATFLTAMLFLLNRKRRTPGTAVLAVCALFGGLMLAVLSLAFCAG